MRADVSFAISRLGRLKNSEFPLFKLRSGWLRHTNPGILKLSKGLHLPSVPVADVSLENPCAYVSFAPSPEGSSRTISRGTRRGLAVSGS
eukprot:scaffold202915_cov24-Attheya_sp.AAC.1